MQAFDLAPVQRSLRQGCDTKQGHLGLFYSSGQGYEIMKFLSAVVLM